MAFVSGLKYFFSLFGLLFFIPSSWLNILVEWWHEILVIKYSLNSLFLYVFKNNNSLNMLYKYLWMFITNIIFYFWLTHVNRQPIVESNKWARKLLHTGFWFDLKTKYIQIYPTTSAVVTARTNNTVGWVCGLTNQKKTDIQKY